MLEELAQNSDPEIQNKALGWTRLRKQDGMHEHESIAPITSRILETMAGPPDHPLYDRKALMVLYSSADAAARDEAQKAVQQRSALMFPILAERSVALNKVAQQAGYQDFVQAQTGLTVGQATQRIEQMCDAQLSQTQADWDHLLERGAAQLGRAPTDADLFALSTLWSAEAGFFLKADAFQTVSERALSKMGFDLKAMNIEIRETPQSPGGAAYGVSIPDDVRFHGNFMDGFEGARGWFHELGHAVHMKEVKETQFPYNDLPFERALSEGVGEVFGAIVRDPNWLAGEFPELTADQRSDYIAATKGLDALSGRFNCYQTRLELSLYAGGLDSDNLTAMHEEIFGLPPKYGPAYNLYIYLYRPLYVWEYVMSTMVTATFLERLDGRPLVGAESGELLRTTLLAPGARLTMKEYLEQE